MGFISAGHAIEFDYQVIEARKFNMCESGIAILKEGRTYSLYLEICIHWEKDSMVHEKED
jgi:hypothetical protein